MFTWLTGRAATTIGGPSEEQDERPDGWPSTVPFRRRPRPLLRVIHWIPPETQTGHTESDGPAVSPPARVADPALARNHDLFVRQRVLREVRSELMGSPEHESFGFLLGRLLYCPWTKTSFVLMDQAWQASGHLPSKQDSLAFREAWTSAWQAARRRQLQVVGWYHSHGLLGAQLSARDMELHRRYFPDPWQTALILVPSGDRPLGGFIQRRSALFFAQSLVPFFEVLDSDAVWRDDAKPSWVDWDNYETEEAIRIVAPSVKPARDEEAPSAPPVVEVTPKPAAETEVTAAPEASSVAGTRPGPSEDESRAAEAGLEEERPRQTVARSLEEEARDFADAARSAQYYDPREGSVSLPSPVLPDLGDVPWRHQGPFQKHLPLPTRHARRPAGTSSPSPDRVKLRPSRERSKFMEVVRGPAPFTAESAELALQGRDAASDPGLAPPDAREATVAQDPVAETKAILLESGPPALEPLEADALLAPPASRLPFRLEPTASAGTPRDAAVETDGDAAAVSETVEPLASPGSLDDLRRWVSAYRRAEAQRVGLEPAELERIARERAEAERVDRERAEAERVDRERAEAERLARGPRVPDTGGEAATDVSEDVRERAPARAAPRPAAPARPQLDDKDDQYEYTVPVVMPSVERFRWLAGLRRHLGRVAALIVLAAAVATAMMLRGGSEVAPTTSYVAPPVSAERLDFARSGEELGRQIEAYEAVRAQFDAGEVDCAGLAVAQAAVSQAFVTLAEKYAVVGRRLPLSERLEYERLAGSARQATTHFQTAGCAEPR